MLFNSYEFIFFFLPLTLVGFYLAGGLGFRRAAVGWLVIASLFFYGWWNPAYVFLLCGSLFFNYCCGWFLSRRRERNRLSPLVVVGVAVNLAVLGYFKYTGFFLSNLGALIGSEMPALSIILPLGISFFTFQQIAFLVDTSRGKAVERDFLDYCLFVTFFPQLIAGPIVHHKEMMPQFGQPGIGKLKYEHLAVGLTIFGIGLFKKVILADTIAPYATMVFDAAAGGETVSLLPAWQGALAYTAQIYFDFSGYSEMAIGLGRMFGIRLPANFNTPYGSVNMVDFWRRWHMTLSRFLREYLYFPLGGNRKGPFRRYVNIMIVMLLGGLWHGAGWTFVVWGGLHGLCVLMNHLWQNMKKAVGLGKTGIGGAVLARTFTLLAVVTAWVFFRAEDMASAMEIIRGMAGFNGVRVPVAWREATAMPEIVGFLGGGFGEVLFFSWKGTALSVFLILLAVIGPNTLEIAREYAPTVTPIEVDESSWVGWLVWRPNAMWCAISYAVILVAILGLWRTSEFLYFQF